MTSIYHDEKKAIRHRKSFKPTSSASHSLLSKTKAGSTKVSWRYVLRWTARVLLVLTVILSSVRVVEILPYPPSVDTLGSAGTVEIDIGRTTAILVLTYNRATYLKRCLESLIAHHPRDGGWPIVISEDRQAGKIPTVAHMLDSIVRDAEKRQTESYDNIRFVRLAFNEPYVRDVEDQGFFRNTDAYRKITKHYGWALNKVFDMKEIKRVVVVEDDMEVAVDFYEYFKGLAPILDNDETVFCVSAWNDNGKEELVADPTRLYRTDFFPGLGWMMTRQLWESELRGKWPKLFWDDWLRSQNQTRGRHCIRPEISRTANFGKDGVSKSFDYEPHISKVVLNKASVNFTSLDLNYLKVNRYDEMIFTRMSNATLLRFWNYLRSHPQNGDVIARFPPGKLPAIGRRLGLMSDHRNGVWRTSYKGVIIIPWNGNWAFIVDYKFAPPEAYRLGARECCNLA